METSGSGDNTTVQDGSGAEFSSSRRETFHIYVLSFAYGILVVSLVWAHGKPECSFVLFLFMCRMLIYIYLRAFIKDRMGFY